MARARGDFLGISGFLTAASNLWSVSHKDAADSESDRLPEHACVRAVTDIREGDELVPKGSTGAVVFVSESPGKTVYGVEFTKPVHTVVTAYREELAPV